MASQAQNRPLQAVSPTLASTVLLLADSYTRCGALLHWIAAEHHAGVERLGPEIRFVSVASGDRAMRILGVVPDLLSEKALHEILARVDRVVVVASPASRPAGKSPADALAAARDHFSAMPLVTWAAPHAEHARAAQEIQRLDGAPFKVRTPIVDAGDFAAVWRDLCDFGTRKGAEPNQATPGTQAASAGAAPIGARVAAPLQESNPKTKGPEMANAAESLQALMQIDGAVGGLIADYQSGMLLAKSGGGVNLEVAAAGNSEVIKSKMKTMQALGLKEVIEDMLITLGTQYHVIRPLAAKPGLFLYLVLDKAKANLAMARFKVQDVEKAMTL